MLRIFLLVIPLVFARNITFSRATDYQQKVVHNVLDYICKDSICSFNGGLNFMVLNNTDWEIAMRGKLSNAIGYYTTTNNLLLIHEEYLLPNVIIHEFYHYFTLQGLDDKYKIEFDNPKIYPDFKEKISHWQQNQQEFSATMFEIWFRTKSELNVYIDNKVIANIVDQNFIKESSPQLYELFTRYFPNNDVCKSKIKSYYEECKDYTLFVTMICLVYVQAIILVILMCLYKVNYYTYFHTLISSITLYILVAPNTYEMPEVNIIAYSVISFINIGLIIYIICLNQLEKKVSITLDLHV